MALPRSGLPTQLGPATKSASETALVEIEDNVVDGGIVAYNLISLKLSCVNWMNKEQGKRDEHTDDLCSVRLAAFLFLFLLILRE
jgi:hypothetical protein